MKSGDKKKKLRRAVVLLTTIGGCWAVRYLGPISLLIFPLMGFGLWCSWKTKSIFAFILLLLLNPLSVSFTHGIADYIDGAPTLRYIGHRRMRSWNVDRQSRAFRIGGISLVFGNEWTWQVPIEGPSFTYIPGMGKDRSRNFLYGKIEDTR